MNEKELKTSPWQRFVIFLIALLMVGSIIAGYIGIVLSGSSSNASDTPEVDEAKIAEYEEAYNRVKQKFSEATKSDFDRFMAYKSEIKAYNETSANENGIQVKDLEIGTGREIGEGDSDYLAYYAGWCADGSVFDSSFDNGDNPTEFIKILDASLGMIEGWNQGVEGMKIEGIRRITVPGELAYGDSMEICGGKNKPLRFLIMAKPKAEPLSTLSDELDKAYMRLQYAYYGVDYDTAAGYSE